MFIKPTLVSLFIAAVLPVSALALDIDKDGLDDTIEVSKGWSTQKQDLALIVVRRPNVKATAVMLVMHDVVDFFAKLPTHNLDGSTGISVHWTWGNPLPASETDEVGGRPSDYRALRTVGMPREWLGLAHGFLVSATTNSGGQTSASDWSGVSNSWPVIVHELGHQLGLSHTPRGSAVASPFYVSLMNYDYSYSYNGKPEAIQFSTGKFADLHLDEKNLNETMPYSPLDLYFLTQAPYFFNIKQLDKQLTSVDFNRNGIHEERGISADINNGTAITPREGRLSEPTAGAFQLATYKGQLVNIFSSLIGNQDWAKYTANGLSKENPGTLRYQFFVDGQPQASRPMASVGPNAVTGAPSALEAFGKLYVTYPTREGYNLFAYTSGAAGGLLQIQGIAVENRAPDSYPILIKTGVAGHEELSLCIWNSITKKISSRRVVENPSGGIITLEPAYEAFYRIGTAAPTPFTSESPIGGAYDSKLNRVFIVNTVLFSGRQDIMQWNSLYPHSREGWSVDKRGMVRDIQNAVQTTLSSPAVLFDSSPNAGENGRILIYAMKPNPDNKSKTMMGIQMRRIVEWGEWALNYDARLMTNQWTTTRSAPSATLFNNEIVWGWRMDETFKDSPNKMLIYLAASGIADEGMTDFDDVSFISNHGLQDSLK